MCLRAFVAMTPCLLVNFIGVHLECNVRFMGQGERILQLVGTFLPVYGILLTVILAVALKGRWRVVVLVSAPLLTYLLCSVMGTFIATDGNMLFVALLGVFMAVLPIYYPILLVVYGVSWIRRKKEEAS